jgi:hypothetical protein
MTRGRKPGHPKTGGRRIGTPNKATLEARELAEKLKIEPLKILLFFAAGDWCALGFTEADLPKIQDSLALMKLRFQAASQAAGFIYPKAGPPKTNDSSNFTLEDLVMLARED